MVVAADVGSWYTWYWCSRVSMPADHMLVFMLSQGSPLLLGGSRFVEQQQAVPARGGPGLIAHGDRQP